jgi:hypothetical protein
MHAYARVAHRHLRRAHRNAAGTMKSQDWLLIGAGVVGVLAVGGVAYAVASSKQTSSGAAGTVLPPAATWSPTGGGAAPTATGAAASGAAAGGSTAGGASTGSTGSTGGASTGSSGGATTTTTPTATPYAATDPIPLAIQGGGGDLTANNLIMTAMAAVLKAANQPNPGVGSVAQQTTAFQNYVNSGNAVIPQLRSDGLIDWRTWGAGVTAALGAGLLLPSSAANPFALVTDPSEIALGQAAYAIVQNKPTPMASLGITAGMTFAQAVAAIQAKFSSSATSGSLDYASLAALIAAAYDA